MAESSNRFIALDKPIEDYIQEQQNKITRAKLRWDVYTLVANSSKQKDETRKVEEIQICANLFWASNEQMARITNHQAFEGFLQMLINRFLKDRKYPVSNIDNKEFDQAKECVEARRTT